MPLRPSCRYSAISHMSAHRRSPQKKWAQPRTLPRIADSTLTPVHGRAHGVPHQEDAAELDDIASSVAGEIDRPTFDRVYGAAIGDGEGHPFLLVDFARRPTHPSMFRRRLNEFIEL